MKINLAFIILLIGIVSCKQNKTTSLPKGKNYSKIKFPALDKSKQNNFYNEEITSQVLVEPGYYVWGLSVINWKGTYHAYYSRWKKEHEHKGWMTHCEIAHATSTSPEGPFKFQNVVLTAQKQGGWDLNNSHNPYAIVAEGKVHLYYIANNIKEFLPKKNGITSYPTSEWLLNNRTILRESQCIGVATADSPAGPFIRSKKVVVAPDNEKFKKIAVNPAVIYRNNTYYMIMKGDDMVHKKPFRIQLVGSSKNPDGPFEFRPKPVYDKAQTEDACFWFDQTLNKHFMVCHVMGKSELALFSSVNGFDWEPDERKIFMKKEFTLSDGSTWKPKRVERPFVLTNEYGQPIMLYIAVYDQNTNGNIALPIEF